MFRKEASNSVCINCIVKFYNKNIFDLDALEKINEIRSFKKNYP
jgi:hypothetical protein